MAAAAVVRQQLALARELHAHAAHADNIGVRRERKRLDVLVDDADLPVRRRQRRQRRQPERRVQRAFAGQDLGQREAKASEALGAAWVDQQQAHRAPCVGGHLDHRMSNPRRKFVLRKSACHASYRQGDAIAVSFPEPHSTRSCRSRHFFWSACFPRPARSAAFSCRPVGALPSVNRSPTG